MAIGMPPGSVIDPEDIADELDRHHRDAMLDLILAWGTLDGALGILLSRVLGLPLDRGAEVIGKSPGSARLAALQTALRTHPEGADAARIMRKHKRSYERHSFVRNRIAHSHCVGVWTRDTDFIVFAAFEKAEDNALAFDGIPIQEMRRATKWGRAMAGFAIRLSGGAD
jgi:hypothetical protein